MAAVHYPELHRPGRSRRAAPVSPAKLRTIQGGQIQGPPASVAPVRVGDLLSPTQVALRLSAANKRQALAMVAEIAARGAGVKAGAIFEALCEREAAGSTGVGHGVAIPHAHVMGLDRLRGVFVSLAAPVDFGAVDEAPVDLIFALLAPLASGSEHLRALSRVARLLRDPEVRRQLRAAPSAAALRALLVRDPAAA
jgi:PTS system nitrogen regulatory IIA component